MVNQQKENYQNKKNGKKKRFLHSKSEPSDFSLNYYANKNCPKEST